MDTGISRRMVTPREFMHGVIPVLSNKGFTQHQISQVEAAFHSHLSSDPDHPNYVAGVDEKVLSQTLGYMRQHPDATQVGPHHWDIVEEAMMHQINHRN